MASQTNRKISRSIRRALEHYLAARDPRGTRCVRIIAPAYKATSDDKADSTPVITILMLAPWRCRYRRAAATPLDSWRKAPTSARPSIPAIS
jgi:hypothetical protein